LITNPRSLQETIESKAMKATNDRIKYRRFGCEGAGPFFVLALLSLETRNLSAGLMVSGDPTVFNRAGTELAEIQLLLVTWFLL